MEDPAFECDWCHDVENMDECVYSSFNILNMQDNYMQLCYKCFEFLGEKERCLKPVVPISYDYREIDCVVTKKFVELRIKEKQAELENLKKDLEQYKEVYEGMEDDTIPKDGIQSYFEDGDIVNVTWEGGNQKEVKIFEFREDSEGDYVFREI